MADERTAQSPVGVPHLDCTGREREYMYSTGLLLFQIYVIVHICMDTIL